MTNRGRYCIWGFVGTALALLGCEQTKYPLQVGDQYQPKDGGETGTVTDVKPGSEGQAEGSGGSGGGSDCYWITVEYEPEWKCTDEQIAEAKAAGYADGYYGEYDYGYYSGSMPVYGGTQGPMDLNADVSLQVKDCEGLAKLRRPELLASYQSALEQNRLRILGQRCIGRTETLSVDSAGNRVYSCERSGGADAGAMGYAATGGTGGSSASYPTEKDTSGASEYSTTNNQVADVDEADFVKNDSGYIYVASTDGIHVIDAWPAADTREVAKLQVTGEPRRLFLEGNRLVAYTRISDFQRSDAGYVYESPYYQECTYGYDCRASSDGGHTLIIVYDVSDPSRPAELVRYEMSGAFVAARRVDSYVYTVVQDTGLTAIPGIDTGLDAKGPEELENQYAARKADIEDTVAEVPSSAFIPWLAKQTSASGTKQQLDSCDNALAGAAAAGTSFLSLVALDIETLARPTRTIVAAKPGFVYASTAALYVAMDGTDGGDYWYQGTPETEASVIHKFAWNGLLTKYVGSLAIRGHVLNQFSMDERDGVLRVATSSGWVPDPNVSSNITTLGEVGGKLARLGELTGLAPTEDIRAVRFDGDRGFVVTFKKTDPLFVINLEDPAQPSVLGELMIPGFSTYLHRLDANHLLAVGFDANDEGSFAWFDGIQIQIFDVTNLSSPQLLHRTLIGTRGSGSEALMDHLAFNYFASRGLLALPLTICEGGGNGVYGNTLTFSGLKVFNVSLANGISEVGGIPFVNTDEAAASGADCSTWWSDSTSVVKRSIFMEDFAYAISDAMLKVAPLSDLGGVLQSLAL